MFREANKRRTFLDQYLTGEVLAEDIDDYVDAWHESSEEVAIYEFLGMSQQEYSLWLRDPSTLPYIAIARIENKPLAEIVDSRLGEMPIAARSSDVTKIQRLRRWLEQHGKIN
jgi:hypothetical protein